MTRTRRIATLSVCAVALLVIAVPGSPDLIGLPGVAEVQAGADTKVFLNGKPVAVYFNDGDSFRVLRGRMKDARARIAGFNTLESHGPVHQWGDWTAAEMYVLAKMATLHARRGVWHCTTDGKLDTYGRMLVHCPDLGESLARLGLAHALTIDDEPADAALLAAQKEAMEARRGIWAHGVPPFIVTSLHSVEEDVNGHGTYNRVVSTEDGHTVSWRHTERYDECQNVCKMEYAFDESLVAGMVEAIKLDANAAALIDGLSDEALAQVVRDFGRFRHVDRQVPEDRRWPLVQYLNGYVENGGLGAEDAGKPVCCMVHVPFKRRYGTGKASCLK